MTKVKKTTLFRNNGEFLPFNPSYFSENSTSDFFCQIHVNSQKDIRIEEILKKKNPPMFENLEGGSLNHINLT